MTPAIGAGTVVLMGDATNPMSSHTTGAVSYTHLTLPTKRIV